MKFNLRFYLSLIYIGVIAGIIGTCLTFILHHVQHFAFGYGLGGEEMSFREGVSQTAPERRWVVLTLCSVLVSAVWYVLHRYGTKILSIKQALTQPQQGAPFLENREPCFVTNHHCRFGLATWT